MQFSSTPIKENIEVPLPDNGRLEEILRHWSRWQPTMGSERQNCQNTSYIVCVGNRRDPTVQQAQLAEIQGLVRAQGDHLVGSEFHYMAKPDPRTLLRHGTAAEIAERALDRGADLLVVDAELTPSQLRNLEDAIGLPVCDREAVILNVFLRNAKTRKAKIQIEIAHLQYLRPRIRGLGLEMDQQAGGVMRGRGPGETASELMARHLDHRLTNLRKAFAKINRSGKTQRRNREGCERITMVGYTNAGKTSLMNGLTETTLASQNRPFETLDTTTRCLSRHGTNVLLSDTVGFIRRLPKRLLDSFASTLAEITEASLLLIVVDAADPEWISHLHITDQMIHRLSAQDIPRFYAFNKKDRLTTCPGDSLLEDLSQGHPYMLLSSKNPGAVSALKNALIRATTGCQERQVFVPYGAQTVLTKLYKNCRVVGSEAFDKGLKLTIEGPAHLLSDIQRTCEELNR